jgi:hypothetical protein
MNSIMKWRGEPIAFPCKLNVVKKKKADKANNNQKPQKGTLLPKG